MVSWVVPAARPIRTALSLLWERGDRWVLRPATRYAWISALGVASLCSAVYPWPWGLSWVLLGIAVALFAGRTLGGRSWLVDWRRRELLFGNQRFPLDLVRGL